LRKPSLAEDGARYRDVVSFLSHDGVLIY